METPPAPMETNAPHVSLIVICEQNKLAKIETLVPARLRHTCSTKPPPLLSASVANVSGSQVYEI
jgi:hypothetical protein